MPERTKRSTLTQEAIRILRNTSSNVPWSRKAEILSDFSLRMKLSGYGEKYRETVILSALAAWDKMVAKDRSGERPLYREKGWRREERLMEKERKKEKWYKKLGGTTNDFTIFCPMSPGGRLAAKWRGVVEETRKTSGGRVRGYVAEQSGIPLSALLYSSQPGEQDFCGKDDCNPCEQGTSKKMNCRKVTKGGVVYSAQCITCKEGVGEGGEVEGGEKGGGGGSFKRKLLSW